jgi:hypothetical protein
MIYKKARMLVPCGRRLSGNRDITQSVLTLKYDDDFRRFGFVGHQAS